MRHPRQHPSTLTAQRRDRTPEWLGVSAVGRDENDRGEVVRRACELDDDDLERVLADRERAREACMLTRGSVGQRRRDDDTGPGRDGRGGPQRGRLRRGARSGGGGAATRRPGGRKGAARAGGGAGRGRGGAPPCSTPVPPAGGPRRSAPRRRRALPPSTDTTA